MSRIVCVLSLCVSTALAALVTTSDASAAEPGQQKVYELRTYHVVRGRMPAMLKRFRDHTTALFEKHGMENVGYWTPEGDDAEIRLIYLLAHKNKEAATKSWQGFRDDPVWHKARDASEKDGKIVERVESVFLQATDFSKLK
jgi:hypothetical protein